MNNLPEKTRVLVTGGAGYIGSHVVLALGQAGCDVLTYDNLSTGRREAVLAGDLVVGDLADRELLAKTLVDYRPDIVMHFAASIEVGESVADPLKYYRNNSVNALNLIEALGRVGIGQMIFSSTAAVYGNPDQLPVTEAAALQRIAADSDCTLLERVEAFDDLIDAEVGDTDLTRARNIERETNLRQLFVKFEGGNPSGTQKDRIAFAQAKDALRYVEMSSRVVNRGETFYTAKNPPFGAIIHYKLPAGLDEKEAAEITLEILDADGNVLARSDNSAEETAIDPTPVRISSQAPCAHCPLDGLLIG